jgi:hypothetical protein
MNKKKVFKIYDNPNGWKDIESIKNDFKNLLQDEKRLDVQIIQVHRPIHIYVGLLYCININIWEKKCRTSN